MSVKIIQYVKYCEDGAPYQFIRPTRIAHKMVRLFGMEASDNSFSVTNKDPKNLRDMIDTMSSGTDDAIRTWFAGRDAKLRAQHG